MFNAGIDLWSVKQLRIKFNIIIKGEKYSKDKTKRSSYSYNLYTVGGNKYFKFTPYPYIAIDISNNINNEDKQKSGNYTGISTFNLTPYILFEFKYLLKELLYDIKESDMYVLKNNILYLNPPDKKYTIINATRDKLLGLVPILYTENKDLNKFDINRERGVSLFINTRDNYINITLKDLEYLIDLLDHIDMYGLAMHLMCIFFNTRVVSTMEKALEEEKKDIIEESKEEEPEEKLSTAKQIEKESKLEVDNNETVIEPPQ